MASVVPEAAAVAVVRAVAEAKEKVKAIEDIASTADNRVTSDHKRGEPRCLYYGRRQMETGAMQQQYQSQDQGGKNVGLGRVRRKIVGDDGGGC